MELLGDVKTLFKGNTNEKGKEYLGLTGSTWNSGKDSRKEPWKSVSLLAHLTFIHYHDLNMVCVTYRSIVIGILGCTVALFGAGCMNEGHLRGGETFLCDPLVVFSDCCDQEWPGHFLSLLCWDALSFLIHPLILHVCVSELCSTTVRFLIQSTWKQTNKQQQKLYLANVIEGSIPLAWSQATVAFGSSSGENKSLHLLGVPHSYHHKSKCSGFEKVQH